MLFKLLEIKVLEQEIYLVLEEDIKNWNPSWGGKTVFFLNKEDLHYVLPKPNSASYFPANIFHFAESTTRHFQGMRISVAWKLRLN